MSEMRRVPAVYFPLLSPNLSMNVAHFCTSTQGGAATAARRLHLSLNGVDGVESCFFHQTGPSPNSTYETLSYRDYSLLDRLRHRLHSYTVGSKLRDRPEEYSFFSVPDLPRSTSLPDAAQDADVVHLHWIANFIDYDSFFRSMPNKKPIVWTLHDMNPFTGGCHYTSGCDRFTDRCGHCPQLNQNKENDLSRNGWQSKHEAFSTLDPERVRIVGDSHWITEQARRSSLLGELDIQTIHYGLDPDVFTPRPAHMCRNILGIPQDAHVIAFGADSISDRRKGLSELIDAHRSIAGS